MVLNSYFNYLFKFCFTYSNPKGLYGIVCIQSEVKLLTKGDDPM